MVSIRDVAKHAGVAISTVSKVLNHYPNVSEETKEKVNAAIKELNFVPNTIAAALSSTQSGRVALIMNLNTQTQAIDEIGTFLNLMLCHIKPRTEHVHSPQCFVLNILQKLLNGGTLGIALIMGCPV